MLVPSETEELGLILEKLLKQLLPTWGPIQVPLFAQAALAVSVVLPCAANAVYRGRSRVKLLDFSFLSSQRRTSSHGHARKRAKV